MRAGLNKMPRSYLKTPQAAALLGLSSATLEDWRWQRKGPPYIRISPGCIRYDEDKLIAWMDKQSVNDESTEELPKASGQ